MKTRLQLQGYRGDKSYISPRIRIFELRRRLFRDISSLDGENELVKKKI